MYVNFFKLTKKSRAIAFGCIELILFFVFLFIGLAYEGKILTGFLIIAISCLFDSIASIVSFVKGLKFGEKKMFEVDGEESTFKLMTALVAILTIVGIILLIIGLVLLLA